MALDWLARGAASHLDAEPAGDAQAGDAPADGARGLVLRDLRVLRKIALPELAGKGHRFLVSGMAEPRATSAPVNLRLRLDGADGVPHYSARLCLNDARPQAAADWPTPSGLVEQPEESAKYRERIYGVGALFHGPRFRAISWLRGMAADGAEGTVIGVDELAWGGCDWYFDVAALDGGMQLAGLWAWLALGGAIPVGVKECRIHRPGLLRGPARGVVHARGVNGVHATCDVAILDSGPPITGLTGAGISHPEAPGSGRPRIELLGVELVLRPDRRDHPH
jgi:hypothetical protein